MLFDVHIKRYEYWLNYIYMGGSKSSETNPIPENGLILSDYSIILLFEAYVPDRINASPWLADDVITY